MWISPEKDRKKSDWQPWQLTASWDRQEMPVVSGEDSHERFKELSRAYWLDPSIIRKYENMWSIKEWVILCITVAETSGWKFGAGYGNIWNVWNNDRWDRVDYGSLEKSLDMIGQTLNNKYLWNKQTLGCLSRAWNCKEENDNWKVYASSEWNWERNMTACLSTIYWQADFSFNIRK